MARQGGGWRDTTASTLLALLQNRYLHYEQIIGAIEVEFARERDARVRQEWHAVQGFLLQATRGLLLERQIKNLDFALSVLEDFGALKKLTEENRPLWVFTTNHDVIVEILAAKFAIPLKSGFTEKITLPIMAATAGLSTSPSSAFRGPRSRPAATTSSSRGRSGLT